MFRDPQFSTRLAPHAFFAFELLLVVSGESFAWNDSASTSDVSSAGASS